MDYPPTHQLPQGFIDEKMQPKSGNASVAAASPEEHTDKPAAAKRDAPPRG